MSSQFKKKIAKCPFLRIKKIKRKKFCPKVNLPYYTLELVCSFVFFLCFQLKSTVYSPEPYKTQNRATARIFMRDDGITLRETAVS